MKKEKNLIRFESKFDKTRNGCWNWSSFVRKTGYGQMWFNGKPTVAHRISYELYKGKIPKGLQIDHLCRNRRCVNPKHLEAVTQKENLLRGNGIPALNHRKTHCPKGHPYLGKNLYKFKIKRTGTYGRACKMCCTINNKKYLLKLSKRHNV